MSKLTLLALSALFLVPVMVEKESGSLDSSLTTLEVTGSRSEYAFVRRGCEGEILDRTSVPLTTGSVVVRHKFRSSPFVLGIQAVHLRDEQVVSQFDSKILPDGGYRHTSKMRSGLLLKPSFGMEGSFFGLSVGVPFQIGSKMDGFPTEQEDGDHETRSTAAFIPSAGFRMGRLDHFHGTVELFGTEPFFFPKGGLSMMFYQPIGRRSMFSGGVSLGGQFEGAGLLGGIEFPLDSTFRLEMVMRIGSGEGISESGIGLGVKKTWVSY